MVPNRSGFVMLPQGCVTSNNSKDLKDEMCCNIEQDPESERVFKEKYTDSTIPRHCEMRASRQQVVLADYARSIADW
jgi:hypothetical protein